MWQDHLEMDLFDFEGVSDMVARLADVDLTDGDASHILNRLYFIKFLSEYALKLRTFSVNESNVQAAEKNSSWKRKIYSRRWKDSWSSRTSQL